MPTPPIPDIQQALVAQMFPTVLMWNRLEGRPRTHNFDRALKAEVRDALWMLTKQWQMGEFKGDDAGTPVFAKVHISASYLNRYTVPGKEQQHFENNIALEVKAEQKKIPFVRNGKSISIDIRLQMGRYWLKLLKKKGLDYQKEFIAAYNFELPAQDRATDYIYAHKEVWQQYAAISGRSMDGYRLYLHIAAGNNASDGIVDTEPGKTALDGLGSQFKKWFEEIYYQPADEKNNAWLPNRLEYQFECSASNAAKEKKLSAEEYYHGRLDWYVFDIEEKAGNTTPGPQNVFTATNTFIPAHVEFDGMPNTRWWKFEDGKTNLGDIKPSTTDLSKLLLMEFGLVFANDWFLVPFTLPVGSLANIEGLTVKNNFGETTWVKAVEESGRANKDWRMFKLASKEQNNTLFLAPAALKVHESNPLEEVILIRDEMSNMVWGIESVVPSPFGKGDKGNEVALRTRQFHEKIVSGGTAADAIPYAANISYLAMTEVPENWIPFVPVHVAGHNRQVQLQRASMLRIIEGDAVSPVKVKPLTSILREGLENAPTASSYYIHEEEVPRSGVKVSQSFQRTRWINGEVFTWLGMKKKVGRGEGSSGLQFDQIMDVKNPE